MTVDDEVICSFDKFLMFVWSSLTDRGAYRRYNLSDRRRMRGRSESPYHSDPSSGKEIHGHHSGGRHRRGHRRSPRTSHSTSPESDYRKAYGEDRRDRRGGDPVKVEHLTAASPASERRLRRYRQAAREAKSMKREKNGKKPFYIMVDREGIPYGSGKPAWMSEINKLSIGLDPSCTYIKKQTYKDVLIFKERLSRSFEYSGELNEAHLRSVMGKAVTRRRGELMKVIANNGSQPHHIDSAV